MFRGWSLNCHPLCTPHTLPPLHYSGGGKTLASAEGIQQGDPLGPLLFCLTIHELCSKLRSELCIFYLDDGTLGGNRSEVLQDLEVVNLEGRDLGLQLNHQKSEVISSDDSSIAAILSVLEGARTVDPSKANLLSSPIGDIDSISVIVREKMELLRLLSDRLKLLFAQDALLLLHHSLAIPKVLYTLRTSPCFLSPLLGDYDHLLRAILSTILNTHFGEDDPSWIQATLPIRCGGLGIQSAVQLALSAFLASAAVCHNLVHCTVPTYLQCLLLPHRSEARAK